MGEMLDARGRTREALAEYEKAMAIHQSLSSADPTNSRARLELATDLAAMGTVQAKLGMRAASLANHTRTVEMCRALSAENEDNVEWRVAIALALVGRADASGLLAKSAPPAVRADDLASAERDYVEAIGILEKLQAAHTTNNAAPHEAQKRRSPLLSARHREHFMSASRAASGRLLCHPSLAHE